MIGPPKDEEALLNAMLARQEIMIAEKKLANSARKEIVTNYERAEFWKLLLKKYRTKENRYIPKNRV